MAEQKDVLDLKQVKRTVDYKDKDGKKVTKEITLNTPSYPDALDITDLTQGPNGFQDFGEAYAKTMEKVLVTPHLDYKFINEQVEKNHDDKSSIEFTDKNDETVKLDTIFPNAREAVNIIFNFTKSDGSANVRQVVQTLNDDVFRDEKGQKLTWDFWQEHGGIFDAIPKVVDNLSTALVHTGFLAIIGEAYSFLQEQI
ncbi:hypothetical protein [Secundilactobacillus yichangensis]|uniref:hypothetical protein n=1 Tax=Secundilactobacillus yichangensis TaxID=2799580 RepID=UPI0019454D88|nr:hypothetical protein [Secundilactobacillus yichangensis]